MNQQQLRDEIKLHLTGGVLELELGDDDIDKTINSALRELQRYLTTTNFITIPYQNCVDLSTIKDPNDNTRAIKISTVTAIYRVSTYNNTNASSITDPMQLALWQMSGGVNNMCAINNYLTNLGAYNTLVQIRNTLSTDLAFRYDKVNNKLYINVSSGVPNQITIEYVPRIDTVEDVTADYWIDILTRMSIALTKIFVGRIRSRYVQSNALWTQDGASILEEGTNELNALREALNANANLFIPID